MTSEVKEALGTQALLGTLSDSEPTNFVPTGKSCLVAKGARVPSLPSGAASYWSHQYIWPPSPVPQLSTDVSSPPHSFSETSSIVLLLDLDTGPGTQRFSTCAHCTGHAQDPFHPGISCPQRLPDLPLFCPFLPPPSPKPQRSIELLPTSCPMGVGKRNAQCTCFPFKQEVRCCVSTDEETDAQINILLKVTANKGQSWDSSLCSSEPRAHACSCLCGYHLLNIDRKAPNESLTFSTLIQPCCGLAPGSILEPVLLCSFPL